MNRRSIIAALLATTLISGLVLAPLGHYAWMALGGHFDLPATGNGSIHGTHRAVSPADVTRHGESPGAQEGARVATFHLTCDYASLFTTTSATAPSLPPTCHPLTHGEPVSSLPQVRPSADVPSDVRPRGPPQA